MNGESTTGRRCAGFTLIELLIVVAIIGILAAIAVPNFLNARLKANIARVYAEIRAIATAQEMYALDNGGGYPPESEDNPYERGRMEAGIFFLTSPIQYMTSIPTDPFVPVGEASPSSPRVYETGVYQRKSKFIAYLLFSAGPDLGHNGIQSASPFSGVQYNAGRGNTYNTSNGLKSSGDIYWYGGNCSITRNLVVDGRIYNGSCPPNFRN